MNAVSRWFLLCLLGSPAAGRAQEVERRQDSPTSTRETIHPALIGVLDELSAVQEALFLAHAAFESGDPEPLTRLFAPTLDGLPEDSSGELNRCETTILDMVEVHLSAAAGGAVLAAFRRSLQDGRPLPPEEVLALFDPAFLDAPMDPRLFPRSIKLTGVMKEVAGADPEVMPALRLEVGPRNAGRLAFAVLHCNAFWRYWAEHTDLPEGEDVRAGMIHRLIRRVEESGAAESLSAPVLTALAFPMRWTAWIEAAPRVVVAPERCEVARAFVGFQRRDLDYLREVLTGLERSRLHSASADEDADGPLVDFVTELRRRIEWELLPDRRGDGEFRMFRGSLRQQKSDWTWYLEQFGVVAFWERARAEIRGMLAGRIRHPLDGDIAALEQRLQAMAADDPAREEVALTLARLRERRLGDQDELTTHLVKLLAGAAPGPMGWTELEAMDREIALARGTSQLIVQMAWSTLAERDPALAEAKLRAHLDRRDPAPITADALEATIFQLNLEPTAATRNLIFEMGLEGRVEDRWAALRHSTSLPPEQARVLFEQALRDVRAAVIRGGADDGFDPLQRDLLCGAAWLVLGRDGVAEWPGYSRCWRELFEQDGVALWNGLDDGAESIEWQQQLVNRIPEADYQALVASGAMPPGFQRVRRPRRE